LAESFHIDAQTGQGWVKYGVTRHAQYSWTMGRPLVMMRTWAESFSSCTGLKVPRLRLLKTQVSTPLYGMSCFL